VRRLDKPRPELPIEPLSELSWQRIERRLFAAGAVPVAEPVSRVRPSRRRLVGLIGVASAAVVALALLAWPRDAGRPARVESIAPTESIAPADPTRMAPSRVETGDSRSEVSFGDVALDVAARSALLVDRDRSDGVQIVLERGEVRCRVAPRAGRPPVVVLAGDVRVEVVGTAFAVARDGDSARIHVFEGEVVVLQRGHVARISAGQRWPSPVRATETETPAPASAPRRPRSQRERVPAAATSPAAPAQPAAARAPSDKTLYERAARLEASDPAAAIAIYAELAGRSGAWSANALYAQGRLELERKNRTRARELLRTYIARYPHGANRADALQLLRQLR
jgi:hypothetical protein